MQLSLTKISLAFFGGLAALVGATAADARNIIIDQSLVPSLIQFPLELPTGSGCTSNVCQVTLPYTVNFGAVTTNKIFVYSSGLISLGAALPTSAFSSAPASIPNFFASSSYNIIASGYRPDDAGDPASLTGGNIGTVTAASLRTFALNNIGACTPAPAPTGKTVCPAGYNPAANPSQDKTPFLDAFITANNLGRFQGDINLRLGDLSYVVFHNPVGGFVDVELFQYYQFSTDTDPVYIGMKNDLALTSFATAQATTYTYRFALVQGVPEPSTWLMMIAGFGMIGGALRRRNVRTSVSYSRA